MTATIATPAPNLPSRFGDATFDNNRAHIRAHYRHLATVVTIQGRIDADNIKQVTDYTRRFILAKNPLILDLTDVDDFGAEGISVVTALSAECRAAGVECILSATEVVADLVRDYHDESQLPIASSVHEALGYFADVIATRRQLMLPLIKKTA